MMGYVLFQKFVQEATRRYFAPVTACQAATAAFIAGKSPSAAYIEHVQDAWTLH